MSTFVLVHGAWGGSYGWRYLRPMLRAAGHDVYNPSLTGLGERVHLGGPEVDLTTHTLDVLNTIEYEDLHDIVLVGHSYGGMVVTGVADRIPEKIRHLIYLDAFLPRDGQSLYDLGGGRQREAPTDDWRVPATFAVQETADPDLEFRRQRLSPQPRRTLEEKVKLSQPLESHAFSRAYVLALGRGGEGPFERAAASVRGNPAWRSREIAGGHGMMRTNPVALALLLEELIAV
ncbi:MAG TPA: alpha/beta fold hydrolase [Chloroflexota bacterium]|nr:alpha/beta fold hydrolase [Chloroflexota bacterium]